MLLLALLSAYVCCCSCGSADFLEAMKIPIDLTGDEVTTCVENCGFAFLFARSFHPAVKYVVPNTLFSISMLSSTHVSLSAALSTQSLPLSIILYFQAHNFSSLETHRAFVPPKILCGANQRLSQLSVFRLSETCCMHSFLTRALVTETLRKRGRRLAFAQFLTFSDQW